MESSLDNHGPLGQGNDRQIKSRAGRGIFSLALIDFFENYDSGDPYHLAAISQLQGLMPDSLLMSDSEWFQTWSVSGRR